MRRHFDHWQQFLGTLSSFKHIPIVLADYYILESNSLLNAALKYKRIQLTDFRIVSMEHFGENKENLSLYCYCGSQMNCSYNIFYIFYPTDLPLKITYPPDFSDSRHYGLLLVMYVSSYRILPERSVHDEFKLFCSDIIFHTKSHKKKKTPWWTLSCEQPCRAEGVCIFNVNADGGDISIQTNSGHVIVNHKGTSEKDK